MMVTWDTVHEGCRIQVNKNISLTNDDKLETILQWNYNALKSLTGQGRFNEKRGKGIHRPKKSISNTVQMLK